MNIPDSEPRVRSPRSAGSRLESGNKNNVDDWYSKGNTSETAVFDTDTSQFWKESNRYSDQKSEAKSSPMFDERTLSIAGDVSFGVVSSLTQRLLTHPCLVFQNQCQINSRSDGSYHLFLPMPWSPIAPLYNMYSNQGALALWKGLYADLVISISTKAIEVIVSENSRLPLTLERSPRRKNAVNTYAQHLTLKVISSVVTTPLVCAAYVLRVQSQLVSADGSYTSIFTEAYQRILSTVFSYNNETSHLLPLYHLVFPITVLSIGSYVINGMALATVQRQYQMDAMSLDDTEHDEIPLVKAMYDRYYPQLVGLISGNLLGDVFLYPLSTVTGRLILQGTRTIIDDVETGNAVLPVTSSYRGVWDCFNTIRQEEGIMGLYKGFGALVMKYTVQFMILRGIHMLYEKVMEIHYPRVPRRNLYPSNTSSIHSSMASLNNAKT